MIGRLQSILFVSVFQGLLAVAIIVIDSSEKLNRHLGFELQSSHVISHVLNEQGTGYEHIFSSVQTFNID